MRQAYHHSLEELGTYGARMCELVSEVMADASDALLQVDLAKAERAISRDVELDEMRAEAEDAALRLLALQAPVASDLRSVVAALWIVADLQRMGQLAGHIARAARREHPRSLVPEPVRNLFEQMSLSAQHLSAQAATVLRTRDLVTAHAMDPDDDRVDALHQEMFSKLLADDWAFGAATAVQLGLVGRFFERYADHAVAVARRVVFLVTGDNIGGDTTVYHNHHEDDPYPSSAE